MPSGTGVGAVAATRVADAVTSRAARSRREMSGMDYGYQRERPAQGCRAPRHPNGVVEGSSRLDTRTSGVVR